MLLIFLELLESRSEIDQPMPAGLARYDVFEDSVTAHHLWLLVNHADAVGNRHRRRNDVDGFGRDADCPFIGPVQAERDVHERRLAGAILAQEADDLGTVQVKIDIAIGKHRPEAFGHAGHFEQWRLRRHERKTGVQSDLVSLRS